MTWENANGLMADVEYYGRMLIDEAYKRIGKHYPQVDLPAEYGGGKAPVVAWIWTRTVRCPNPACGHETPLIRSFDVAKKRGKEMHVDLDTTGGKLQFSVGQGKSRCDGTVNRK